MSSSGVTTCIIAPAASALLSINAQITCCQLPAGPPGGGWVKVDHVVSFAQLFTDDEHIASRDANIACKRFDLLIHFSVIFDTPLVLIFGSLELFVGQTDKTNVIAVDKFKKMSLPFDSPGSRLLNTKLISPLVSPLRILSCTVCRSCRAALSLPVESQPMFNTYPCCVPVYIIFLALACRRCQRTEQSPSGQS